MSRRTEWALFGMYWVFIVLGAALYGQNPVVNDDEHVPGNMDRPSQRELLDPQRLAARVNTVPAVLTHSYDNLRSGANTHETQLTPATVRNGLRMRFTVSLAGDARGLEAQPLLVPNVQTGDGAAHDLLVLASMGNIVTAVDATDGTPLWLQRLAVPIQGSRALDAWLVNDHWGVLSTPVIQGTTLYVVAWGSPDGTPERSAHYLYALSLRDGSRLKPSLALTTPTAGLQRKQRAALTLVDSTLFIPWGTIQETAVGAHGFITAVDTQAWRVVTELNITPTGKGGGIWQAGQGLIADAAGFLYAMTGNGDYDGAQNFSESFLKLRYDGAKLAVVDHYAPFQDKTRAAHYDDMDLGSGGPSLIPELGLLMGAGKDGILYTMPWRRLAAPLAALWYTFYPGPGIPATPQDRLFFDRTHHMHSSSVTWKAGTEWRMFCWGENSNLRAWRVDAAGAHYVATGAEVASVQSPVPPGGMPGGFMALSANGGTDGIVWATVPFGDANRGVTQGYLAAYDVTTFGKFADGSGAITRLWQSPPFTYNKFNPPVVAGGLVYVPTYDGRVLVFGL